jgi:hypothetical protein
MKAPLFAAALLIAPLLAGCATSSRDQANRAEAWSRCRTAPNPETRDRCIETEIALLEARQDREAASRAADRKAAEEREAIREAQGISREDARETTDSGLRAPQ